MAIIKCKMCGGDLRWSDGASTATCEYCGSVQTVPVMDDEKKLTLFSRANRLRFACEFDKAAGIYESIVADFPEEAEAYWGLVLCKYGIEYVDDPGTGKKIPTCHRSSFDSIMDDSDFEQACENADAVARRVYRDEAKAIEEIRKGIITVSSKEAPYDIFICYKETDDNGNRTLDSVLAQDIYDALTAKGYRTFFSRISLEDKLGLEYEPYIFAALNSAKVMLAIGTDYEYYNAVWVKNEWSRFLKLMAKDSTKHLIPCYKGIDAYDMPKEFAKLQAQDMGKIGAMQDLLRGVDKLLAKAETATPVHTGVTIGGDSKARADALVTRGNMALEDGDWAQADKFFEEALNNDPKSGYAYIGKALAESNCRTLDEFVEKRKTKYLAAYRNEKSLDDFEDTSYILKAASKYSLAGYLTPQTILAFYKDYDEDLKYYYSLVDSRKQQYNDEKKYWETNKLLMRAEQFSNGQFAEELQGKKAQLFNYLSELIMQAEVEDEESIAEIKREYQEYLAATDIKVEQAYSDALKKRESDYELLQRRMREETNPQQLFKIAELFDALKNYKESKNFAQYCRDRAREERAKLDQEAERKRKEKETAAALEREKEFKFKVTVIKASVMLLSCLIITFLVILPAVRYKRAMTLFNAGEYKLAWKTFDALEEQTINYRDCKVKISECKYRYATESETGCDVIEAYETLVSLGDYKDSAEKAAIILESHKIMNLKNVTVGDQVFLGTYEQDNIITNGAEDIAWIVLEVKNSQALLISKYALDCQPYHETDKAITWKNCSLRKWLNKDFINTAFSNAEKAKIPLTIVSSDWNPEYDTYPGLSTADQVFLLSLVEYNEIFQSIDQSGSDWLSSAPVKTIRCYATEYATANGANKDEYNYCTWWLRSPGFSQNYAVNITGLDFSPEFGSRVNYSGGAVRPALWIDLS